MAFTESVRLFQVPARRTTHRPPRRPSVPTSRARVYERVSAPEAGRRDYPQLPRPRASPAGSRRVLTTPTGRRNDVFVPLTVPAHDRLSIRPVEGQGFR
jgi:hypothetical protein